MAFPGEVSFYAASTGMSATLPLATLQKAYFGGIIGGLRPDESLHDVMSRAYVVAGVYGEFELWKLLSPTGGPSLADYKIKKFLPFA